MKIDVGDTVLVIDMHGNYEDTEEECVDITSEYDSFTKRTFEIIHIEGDREFDSRTGEAITPPLNYRIEVMQ